MISAPTIKLIQAKTLFSLFIIGYKTTNNIPNPNVITTVSLAIRYSHIIITPLSNFKFFIPFTIPYKVVYICLDSHLSLRINPARYFNSGDIVSSTAIVSV